MSTSAALPAMPLLLAIGLLLALPAQAEPPAEPEAPAQRIYHIELNAFAGETEVAAGSVGLIDGSEASAALLSQPSAPADPLSLALPGMFVLALAPSCTLEPETQIASALGSLQRPPLQTAEVAGFRFWCYVADAGRIELSLSLMQSAGHPAQPLGRVEFLTAETPATTTLATYYPAEKRSLLVEVNHYLGEQLVGSGPLQFPDSDKGRADFISYSEDALDPLKLALPSEVDCAAGPRCSRSEEELLGPLLAGFTRPPLHYASLNGLRLWIFNADADRSEARISMISEGANPVALGSIVIYQTPVME